MRASDRWAYETETINRALQHDLVLFGHVTVNSGLVVPLAFRTRDAQASVRFRVGRSPIFVNLPRRFLRLRLRTG